MDFPTTPDTPGQVRQMVAARSFIRGLKIQAKTVSEMMTKPY